MRRVPIRPERGGITTSARPELRLNRVLPPSPASASSRRRQVGAGGKARRGVGIALEDQIVTLGNRVAPERHARLAVLYCDEGKAVLRLQVGRRCRGLFQR